MGIGRILIYNEIITILGDKYLSYSFVTKWIRLFKEAIENLEVEQLILREITATIPTNIEVIGNFIEEDPY